jgi:nucleoporin POM34
MSLARTPAAAPRAPATPATPSTPTAQADEIARRQYATTFDERNVRAVLANAGLLFLSVYGNTVVSNVKLLEYAAYVPTFSLPVTRPLS